MKKSTTSKAEFPTPDDLTLPEIMARFATERQAREYLESIRWPVGPVCAHCGNRGELGRIWKIGANPEKKIREGLYQCAACEKHFTVTIGTIFEDSHIPLNKWLVAWYLFATAKKGVSALQMQRTLGLGSYRTAWFMMHRIRHAVATPDFQRPLSGTVEVDETFVGGKSRGRGQRFANKTAVVSLVERGPEGRKRSVVVANVTAKNLRQAIRENVEPGSTVHTDDFAGYKRVPADGYKHGAVNHTAGQYVRDFRDGTKITTNTVESSFAIIKRAIYGSFHHVSKKHLPRYLAEFDHKWDTRHEKDGARCVQGLRMAEGKRLTMHPLIGDKEAPEPS
ncbi:MAG: IS1595 family transposase [Prosthecobacter sp.]|nr:IS1595 family transposase [Prosthecobacter sp.]